MIATCCICERSIELDIDAFLEIEQEIDDFICDDCADLILEYAADWFNEWELRKN